MRYNNVFLRLALIFSETCFQILLYLCVIGLFKGSPLVNPLFFFVLTGVLTIVNLMLATGNFRRLTVVGINILLLGLLIFLGAWQTGFILFSMPREGFAFFNVIFVVGLILWLGFRSLYLAYKSSPPDIYSHFDLYIFLTFLVFLIMGVVKIVLPGGLIWIITVIFLNLLPLYIDNNTGEKTNPLSGWVLAIAMILLVFLSIETVSIFPHISGTAESVFGLFEKGLLILLNLLVRVLVWNKSKNRSEMDDLADQSANDIHGLNLPTTTDSYWQQIIMQGVSWLLMIILCVCVVIAVYHLMRFIISWLLQRQAGNTTQILSAHAVPLWKRLYGVVLKTIKEIGYFVLLFLPGRVSVDLAYDQLLRWGCGKRYPRHIHETPYDYYQRLVGHYPELRSELNEITSLYVVYRYSDEGLSELEVPNLKPMVRRVYLSGFRLMVSKIRRMRLR